FECSPCGDQINNGVSQTHQRGKLHGTVELDEIYIDPFAGKVFTRCTDVFGCNPQPRTLVDSIVIIKTFRYCHAHTTAGDIQVNRLIQTTGMMLHMLVQDIFASDANMGSTILNISRDICGADNNNLQIIDRKSTRLK